MLLSGPKYGILEAITCQNGYALTLFVSLSQIYPTENEMKLEFCLEMAEMAK